MTDAETNQTTGPTPRNGAGVAALVLGIVAVVTALNGWWLFLLPVALATGILAVVFGRQGRRHASTGEATNSGQATAGLVLGTVALSLVVLTGVGFAIWGGSWDGDDKDKQDSFAECIDDAEGVGDLQACLATFPDDAAQLGLTPGE